MDFYVIRQNSGDGTRLYEEIKCGRLRQGWSFNPGLSLEQSETDFAAEYAKDAAKQEEGRTRYAILRPMQHIKPGDVIIVPKQPDYDHFLVLVAATNPEREASSSYAFVEPLDGTNDYRNVVFVDPNRVKVFHFDGKSVPSVMKQKLRSIAYSSAVNTVGNHAFVDGILKCLELDERPNQVAEPLKAKLTALREEMYRGWIKAIRALTPSDFEKLVQAFMQAGGYKIVRLNHYDRKGSDVDLECERTFDLDDPLVGRSHTVRYRIQIKKHEGKSDENAVRQLIDEHGSSDAASVRKISLVISTADDFTDDCKRLAEKHAVSLMNGVEFARSYFRSVEQDE